MSDERAVEQTNNPSVGLVFRNTFLLLFAQIITTPLSILVNAVMGRYLGPIEFGHLYMAWTFCSFAQLLLEWGQDGTIPSIIAKDRAISGRLLGSAIAWRVAAFIVSASAMMGIADLLGYGRDFLCVLALAVLITFVQGIVTVCMDAARGFERTDITAYGNIGQQFLVALLVIPTLLIGGGVRSVLLVQLVVALVIVVLVSRLLKPIGVTALLVKMPIVKRLLVEGSPFLFFGVGMVLQPNVDAVFLSRLAPPETVGWHAAARRLVGVLVTPAVSLGSALYPTLCRLSVEDGEAFKNTVAKATIGTLALAMPAALGCGLYPEIGVSIFSSRSFGPAADNLRILSVFLLLVYVSMALGTALLAAGRQKQWASVQLLCVVVSVVLDPILIPWFQEHRGNGGLGICVATVASEVVMVSAAVWMMPKGIFAGPFLRRLLPIALSGGAMAVVARVLSGIPELLSAPVACVAYGGALWMTGGVDADQVAKIREFVRRKFKRR